MTLMFIISITDRGTEFSSAEEMETSADGTRRTRVITAIPCSLPKMVRLKTNT